MRALVRTTMFLLAVAAAACAGQTTGDDSGDDGFTGDDSSGDDSGGDDSSGDDSGGDDTGPTDCESEIVEPPTTPGCAAATQTCIEECEDDACYDACFAADPDPDGCNSCLEDAYLACANTAGCQPEWDAMICCYDGCPDPDSAACETSCAADGAAYDACAEQYDETCGAQSDAACFP
jgi:hypothetical protein